MRNCVLSFQLETPIEFNHGLNPISLSRSLRPEIGEKAMVAGFGLVFKKLIRPIEMGLPGFDLSFLLYFQVNLQYYGITWKQKQQNI